MYRERAEGGESLVCPACLGVMRPLATAWRASACEACGGVWADNEASARVAAAFDPDLVAAADGAADRARRWGAPLPPDGGAASRGCPTCERPLERSIVGATRLDLCAAHGTFFDRDELHAVARSLESLRNRPPVAARWSGGAATALNGSDPTRPAQGTELDDFDDVIAFFTAVLGSVRK